MSAQQIGVYDRYWSTGGGAERVAAAFAAALTHEGQVSLIGHEPIDRDWLESRFGVDLTGVDTRVLPDRVGALSEASADLDVLVNASFMSAETNRSSRGLYYVHFPTPLEAPATAAKRVLRKGARWLRGGPDPVMTWGDGFHHRDAGSRAPIWTDGRGVLHFELADGEACRLRLVFAAHRPASTLPTDVRVTVDGTEAGALELHMPSDPVRRQLGQPLELELVGNASGTTEVVVESDSFVPADIDGGSDRRRLGVPLRSIIGGGARFDLLARAAPSLFHPPASADWLASYQVAVSNSEFTRGWVERYWRAETGVLYPPVPQFEPTAKTRTILSVGRFFPQEMGHSKRQLEMVEAFRSLQRHRELDGWRLVLAGGCDDGATGYLDAVRAAATGLPVDIRANAPFADLVGLYGEASIYWHAAGLGVDDERHPDRLEHFGIVTGEAMSAGAVPIVVDLAGQREIVRHGVDGYRFRTQEDLVDLTRHLIATDGQLERMSTAARGRAAAFGPAAFEAQVHTLLENAEP